MMVRIGWSASVEMSLQCDSCCHWTLPSFNFGGLFLFEHSSLSTYTSKLPTMNVHINLLAEKVFKLYQQSLRKLNIRINSEMLKTLIVWATSPLVCVCVVTILNHLHYPSPYFVDFLFWMATEYRHGCHWTLPSFDFVGLFLFVPTFVSLHLYP